MNGDRIDDRDVDIDLARLVAAIWQRKGRIAAITLLAGGAAFVVASMMSPAYKGEARVLIEIARGLLRCIAAVECARRTCAR